jgi:hypothetical protein
MQLNNEFGVVICLTLIFIIAITKFNFRLNTKLISFSSYTYSLLLSSPFKYYAPSYA